MKYLPVKDDAIWQDLRCCLVPNKYDANTVIKNYVDFRNWEQKSVYGAKWTKTYCKVDM